MRNRLAPYLCALTLALLTGAFALRAYPSPPLETYPDAFAAIAASRPDSLAISLEERYDAEDFALQAYRRTAPPESRYDEPKETAGCILLVRQADGSFAAPQQFEHWPVKPLYRTFQLGGACYAFAYLPEGAEPTDDSRLSLSLTALQRDDPAQPPKTRRVTVFPTPKYKLYVRRVSQNGEAYSVSDVHQT